MSIQSIEIGKIVTQSAYDPHWTKIFSFLATEPTTVVHGTWKNSMNTLSSTKKIFSFLATVLLWCIGLRKNSIGIRPSPGKKILISGYNTTMMHGFI